MVDDHVRAPHAEYGLRKGSAEEQVQHYQRRDALIGYGRLFVFFAGAGLAIIALGYNWVPASWIGLPIASFVALMVLHEITLRQLARAERKEALYARMLKRLDGKWRGEGQDGLEHQPAHHRYCADLDLFGPGSLFELLCEARTVLGEQTLAHWLCEPVGREQIERRQQAISELRPQLQLREDLQLLGDDIRSELSTERLCGWAEAPAHFSATRAQALRLVAAILGLANVAALVSWSWVGAWPFVASAVTTWLVLKAVGPTLGRIAAAVDQASAQLELLSALTHRLQQQATQSPYLDALRAELGDEASEAISALSKLISWLDSLKNAFFAPIGWVLLLPAHLALAVEAWRGRHGKDIGRWLDAVGELEALCSLSAFAYEHPDDPFAELASGDCAILEAEQIAHPLLDGCIANSLALDRATRALIVSGSNMSGKSTLLRTVGINVVLAMLGAPIRAKRLLFTPLDMVATMRVHDSLQDGESRFYAEVVRLKELFERVTHSKEEHPRPMLFLLDELLHGTNSHDRKVGAKAIVERLVEAGALGLVTTHDLSLSVLADELESLANVHFCDEVRDGELTFDFRLKEGIVERSNALELMRGAGLPV